MRWDELTWVEFDVLSKEQCIALLPVGSIEQHGPHLPLGLDYMIVDRLSDRFIVKARTLGLNTIKLPPIPYGLSHMWLGNPGTISIDHSSFMNYVCDVVRSIIRWGVKYVLILNGHAGNSDALRVVASRITNEFKEDSVVVVTSWWELVNDVIKELFNIGFFHADEVETSVALALNINVKGELMGSEIHRRYDEFWHSLDLTKRPKIYVYRFEAIRRIPGSYGNPKAVDIEKGVKIVEHVIDRLIKLSNDLLAGRI